MDDIWICVTCGTSWRWPRSATSVAPPSGSTWPSRRSPSRSASSRPSWASSCSTAPHAAWTSPRASRAYLERARAILADVDEAAHHARLVAGSVGHVAIGCVGSATYSLLPALSRRLTEELPGVDFAFRGEMLAPDQVEALRTGAIDVALLRPVAADLSLTVHTLRRDRLVVAVPVDHRLARRKRLRAADLAGADLIVHSADRRSVMYDVVLGLLRDSRRRAAHPPRGWRDLDAGHAGGFMVSASRSCPSP